MLKSLTAGRLAALNHGSIRTPIEGREGQEVLRRCRAWAAEIGEVRIGDDPANPTITLQLTAVDTESILANADRHDNTGNRRRAIREILFRALGVEDSGKLMLQHDIVWRGTPRHFDVVFANVRELPDESLATRPDERKLVIDFPFDEPEHARADDIARLDDYRRRGGVARTLVWLPSFLTTAALKDLGTFVKLDYVLAGDRLRDFASHLSPVDQASARELLRNQRSQLRQRLIHYLEGAYGVEQPTPGSVDESHPLRDHFQSLDPAFTPRPPARANLRDALAGLLDQMLASQYPAHPTFGAPVKPAALRSVRDQVSRAVQEPEGRVAVDKPLRATMTQIAVPLRLGEMGETHFVLGRHWFSHFEKLARPLTVAKLRAAIDDPRRMGLPAAAENLVILIYADQANLAFRLHGGPWKAALTDLPDEVELREEALPAPDAWETAVGRAGTVFGITVSPLRNASNAGELAAKLGEAAAGEAAACSALAARLASIGEDLSIAADDARRLRTARATGALVEALGALQGKARIEKLAAVEPDTSLEAMGTSFRKAAAVLEVLERTKWTLLTSLGQLTDDRAGQRAPPAGGAGRGPGCRRVRGGARRQAPGAGGPGGQAAGSSDRQASASTLAPAAAVRPAAGGRVPGPRGLAQRPGSREPARRDGGAGRAVPRGAGRPARPHLEAAAEGQEVTSAPWLAQVRAQVQSVREELPGGAGHRDQAGGCRRRGARAGRIADRCGGAAPLPCRLGARAARAPRRFRRRRSAARGADRAARGGAGQRPARAIGAAADLLHRRVAAREGTVPGAERRSAAHPAP